MFADLILYNFEEVFSPLDNNRPLKGKEMNQANILKNGFIAIKDDFILDVGQGDDYKKLIAPSTYLRDCSGKVASPGLIDAHTHLVFGGSREHEFSMKLNGMEYMEILQAGGGILSTLKSTREASFEELYEKAYGNLDKMLAYGVTSVEAKSGYGLNLENELKQLEVIKKLNQNHSIDLYPTLMAAHATPPEFESTDDYVDYIIDEIIPEVAEKKLASFNDVFCEDGVFSVDQSRKILEAGKKFNLIPRVHADEIVSLGGAELAAEVEAISAEHLMAASEEGMKLMAENNVIANLLPATTFSLMKETYADARKFLDYGNALTICSDFNPGSCPSENLQFAMFIAVYKMRLTPVEVLNAVTINASHSIANNQVGSFTKGKKADITIFNAPNIDFIFYNLGVNNVTSVYKNGKLVF